MSRPVSVADVLARVRRSGLVPEERLNRFLGLLPGVDGDDSRAGGTAVANTPATVLAGMVEQGLLTKYQSHELAAGRTSFNIGPFRILDLIGRGGMGDVYLAENPLLGKRVAVKVLTSGERSDEAGERFVREARTAAALDDPNIVRVFDVNITHDPPYLVMEYVDGISLQAAVARHGAFAPGEAAEIGIRVLMGLQSLADAGLVHRDIKPANILVDRKGGVKILDLGIARFNTDPTSRAADTQSILGTLDYLAPEQAIDSSLVDVRADLYSLGATLFFLLAGHPPFADDSMERKLVRKQQSNPPSIEALRLDVPPGLANAINTLLARSASDRYRSPREAAEALLPFAGVCEEFPRRLFRDEHSINVDPSPTPLPPTRRILRRKTEHRGLSPEFAPPPDSLPVSRPEPPKDFVRGAEVHESGRPTERIKAPVSPKWWCSLGWRYWLCAAALIVLSLFVAILGRTVSE